ncbi:MFS transporter TsgA [Buchnera aphidicola]|uniref:Protein TsgA homolog n=1 Tax=Buchnera aphidicola str. USDA (Myzus persicae) TaxID=1009856 RepID=W0P344_BUCMP|nr:MFS transporter TsgA [Buchnera aphidicola]AHG59867.1 Yhfc [Buchnera aphidicola str. USDA (Myzus persicae)]AHG60447.1 Yhfc [Buchnera aphidicola str. W106 (Myzus persicae)]AHG61592.1 Yhfc [Buchnera aphidicola str. F009 (Myzus persicae)]WAI02894.1 MAG: MFS transporter TsgA [Buchnera aphidicola (Myzus persicae)]
MTNINKIGLTWISFFSYAFTGGLVVVTGIIMGNIADYFHLSVSKMSNIFTFLNAGILIAILLNSWLIETISLKKQLIFGFFLTVIAIVGIVYSHSVFIFSINMFILGLVSGITMSIGTFLITYLYSGSKRGSKLLLTDSFFSMSGMIFPIVSAYFLEKKIIWYWTYISIGGIYLLILILSIIFHFPKLKNNTHQHEKVKENWNLNIILLAISALLYILGQLGFISWVPQYATEIINIDIKKTGNLVSSFWMSYMIGMWFFSFIIKFFSLHRIFIFLTGISSILMYFFIHIQNYIFLQCIIVSLGFFSSAIYTIIITLASLQTKNPSPKLINLILLFGTIGTLLTFIVTSPIVEKKGLYTTLFSANIFYGVVFLLSILIYINTKYRKNFI